MKIVLVDDSDQVRERLKSRIAELSGIAVVGEAADVAEALQVIQAQEPHAVLLDIQMPGGSGIDILREVKRAHPETVVIMLTNYATPQYRHAYLSAGADYFLDKFADQGLLPAILGALRR